MQLRVIWLIGGQCVIFVLILAENCVFVASLDPIKNSRMVFVFLASAGIGAHISLIKKRNY